MSLLSILFFFFFNDPAPTEIYTLSLHDALPISSQRPSSRLWCLLWHGSPGYVWLAAMRSEEHTSELQSLRHLVCRLLLEKKKKIIDHNVHRILNNTIMTYDLITDRRYDHRSS